MNKYDMFPPTKDHIEELATTMRQADKDEVWAAGNRSPKEALTRAVDASEWSVTGLANDKVIVIFGALRPSLMSNKAAPWALVSDNVVDYVPMFLKLSKLFISRLYSEYDVLYNYVDVRNTAAIRWLKWLKFDLSPPIPYGADQLLFHPFKMVK